MYYVAAARSKLFRPFQAAQWGRDLPPDRRKRVPNAGAGAPADVPAAGPALEAVGALAEVYGVDRGQGDVLVADEDTQMTGAVSGGHVTVATRFGTVKAPLAEAALVAGGAGVDRAMAVHLRNGEVLAGPVEFHGAVLKVESLVLVRSPQPIYRLALADGSRWSLMLGGGAWDLPTVRFGPLSLEPSAVARLTAARLFAPTPEGDEPAEELKRPHVRLAGDIVVTGTIAADKLKIETSSGMTTVDTSSIVRIEAAEDEAARGLVTLEMLDESQVTGRLADGVLPVRAHGRVWSFPTRARPSPPSWAPRTPDW